MFPAMGNLFPFRRGRQFLCKGPLINPGLVNLQQEKSVSRSGIPAQCDGMASLAAKPLAGMPGLGTRGKRRALTH